MKRAGFNDIWPIAVSCFSGEGLAPGVIDPETVFFKVTFSAF
jgi:hypothetical protein